MTKCLTFQSAVHHREILHGFNQLREEGSLLDIKLVASDGKTFAAHRSLLASCSDYFKSMSTCSFKEQSLGTVKLHGINSTSLHQILQYVYTGIVNTTIEDVPDLLDGATHLLLAEVVNFCEKCICTDLKVENAVAHCNLAQKYSLACEKKIHQFIAEHFTDISKDNEFMDFPIDTMCSIIDDEHMRSAGEIEVFRICVKWLSVYADRKQYTERLLKLVRYGLLNLEDIAEVQVHPLLINTCFLSSLGDAFAYHTDEYKKPFYEGNIYTTRGAKDKLVITEFDYVDGTCSLLAADLGDHGTTSDFRHVTVVPGSMYVCCCASVNNFMYFAGVTRHQEQQSACLWRYNTHRRNWLQLSPMRTKRFNFTLVYIGKELLALGGAVVKDRVEVVVSGCERYSIVDNIWSKGMELPNNVKHHASIVMNGKLYVSGGCNVERNVYDRMSLYEPDSNKWSELARMNHGRRSHVMAEYKEKIYVCGGNNCHENVNLVERYDACLNQWTVICTKRLDFYTSSSVVWGDKIIILGALERSYGPCMKNAFEYNPEKDEWSSKEKSFESILTAGFLRL